MKYKYSLQYFIKKFEKIPRNEWTTGRYHSEDYTKSCALGHCGHGKSGATLESAALKSLTVQSIIDLNDGTEYCPEKYKRMKHPKTRIVNFLKDLLKERK